MQGMDGCRGGVDGNVGDGSVLYELGAVGVPRREVARRWVPLCEVDKR